MIFDGIFLVNQKAFLLLHELFHIIIKTGRLVIGYKVLDKPPPVSALYTCVMPCGSGLYAHDSTVCRKEKETW